MKSKRRHPKKTHPPNNGGRQRRAAVVNRVPTEAALQGRSVEAQGANAAAAAEVKKKISQAVKAVKDKQKFLEARQRDFDEWKASVGPVTKDEFVQHGNDIVKPGYRYFQNLFINPEGKLRNLFLAYRGARLFDPMFLSTITITAACMLADDLLRFGFPELTATFMRGFKLEIRKMREQALEPFAWDELPGAAKYDSDLRNELAALDAANADPHDGTREPPPPRTWREDPNERARRIWMWWKIRVYEVEDYQCANIALRLVALAQPSSCSLERDFSQLKLIVETCGQMLQSTLESRMCERCNNGKSGLPMM